MLHRAGAAVAQGQQVRKARRHLAIVVRRHRLLQGIPQRRLRKLRARPQARRPDLTAKSKPVGTRTANPNLGQAQAADPHPTALRAVDAIRHDEIERMKRLKRSRRTRTHLSGERVENHERNEHEASGASQNRALRTCLVTVHRGVEQGQGHIDGNTTSQHAGGGGAHPLLTTVRRDTTMSRAATTSGVRGGLARGNGANRVSGPRGSLSTAAAKGVGAPRAHPCRRAGSTRRVGGHRPGTRLARRPRARRAGKVSSGSGMLLRHRGNARRACNLQRVVIGGDIARLPATAPRPT